LDPLSIVVALGMVILTVLALFVSYWNVDPVQEPLGCLLFADSRPPDLYEGLIETDEKIVGLKPVNSDEPLLFAASMTRPEVIHCVQPCYTEVARRARLEGSVITEAIIDRKDRVDGVRVLLGLPFGLDRAAVEAIRQWRFKPATLDKKPVKVYFRLTIDYKLSRES
jgi:TonB family protein